MLPKLGIIAGGGDLPARLVQACRQSGREVFVIAFEGQTDTATVVDVPHMWTRLGAAGSGIERLKAEGVRELVMAGGIRRPSLTELKPDWRAAKLFARIGLKALGDDGLLRTVVAELETEGFRIVAAQDVFSPLLAPSGVMGAIQPNETAWSDIRRGLEVTAALGQVDVGQAVVVQQGLVLGVEAIEGTDALIRRAGALQREGERGVLVKLCKPQQDRRLDLPTIGITTVEQCAEAGLAGLAVETGRSLIVDRTEVIAVADRLGLFVVGVEPPKT